MLQRKLSFSAALLFVLCLNTAAQTITQKLTEAFYRFEKDSQMRSGLASLYVTDGSGKVVFQKNATVGLAPASTQKIITTATAYELLGKSFRYQTEFGFINNGGENRLYIRGSGDPTFGSWRWEQTKETAVINRIIAAGKGIRISPAVVLVTKGWNGEAIPGGWMWEDIANYYGAGAGVFNWRENQYDLFLRSGNKLGDPVAITGAYPDLYRYKLVSKAVAATKGSGDNAYIYFPLSGDSGVVRGTIPVGEARFVISGAMPDPARQFAATLLKNWNTKMGAEPVVIVTADSIMEKGKPFYTDVSPPLDSLIYWFNKKSINLYGEALLKTIAYQKTGAGSTEAGVRVLQQFWNEKGIPQTALNVVDGSELSPLNRITTGAQVAILQYAKTQPWFSGFYHALPEYNGMKLKSGTIRGVKGFAGYHTGSNGTSYVISFLVNNYNGSPAALVKKMYAVLDVLK